MKPLCFPLTLLATFAALLLAVAPTQGAIVTFSGIDAGAGPNDARPLSTAAAASFDSAAGALGSNSLVTFENAAVGSFTNLLIAPGVTLSQTGTSSLINNVPAGSPAVLYGFNTTAGGSHYVDIEGPGVTFTFAKAIQSFGAYFTGVQSLFGTDTLTLATGARRRSAFRFHRTTPVASYFSASPTLGSRSLAWRSAPPTTPSVLTTFALVPSRRRPCPNRRP